MLLVLPTLSKALPHFSGTRITILTSTFPLFSFKLCCFCVHFHISHVVVSLPDLMRRQISLAGLYITAFCTQASMITFLCSLGYTAPPSKSSQGPMDPSSSTITIFWFSLTAPKFLSPPDLDLAMFPSSLWLCHLFWFRCLFNLSRIIQSPHFLQEVAASSNFFNKLVAHWRQHVLSRFSCIQTFATLWTVAHQAPLSMGFSRQE